jgi:hypothetical protein
MLNVLIGWDAISVAKTEEGCQHSNWIGVGSFRGGWWEVVIPVESRWHLGTMIPLESPLAVGNEQQSARSSPWTS